MSKHNLFALFAFCFFLKLKFFFGIVFSDNSLSESCCNALTMNVYSMCNRKKTGGQRRINTSGS